MTWIIGFAAAFVLLLIYMWIEAHVNRVITKEIHMEKLPESFDSFCIFFISDLHNRIVSNQMIEEVKGKADIVIIGGDIMEKGVSFEKVNKNLTLLREVAPCYFVWGNNDYEEDPVELERLLLKKDIHILRNDSMNIRRKNESISLLGIDDLSTQNYSLENASMNAKASTRILVSHNPDIKHELTNESDIQLLLSGHTHGGQIRILGWGIREKGGISRRGNTTVVISNGYGTTTLPLRLMAPAESHLFVLRRK